jgi:hypothetical protein
VRTLKRRFPPDTIPYPKHTKRRMPKVLSPEEVARLLEVAVHGALSHTQAPEKQHSFPIASVRREHQRLPSNPFSKMPRLEPIEYLFAALYAEAFPIKASGFTTSEKSIALHQPTFR